MASKAQGQFTIIDYNDALTLTGYISSNLPKTQLYNPDNGDYNPNWTKTNAVLTPSVYIAGTTDDKIGSAEVQSVKWFDGNSTSPIVTNSIYTFSGAKNHILTIKDNVMQTGSGKDFRCEVEYLDPTTQLTLKYTMPISFSRVTNGSGITDLIVTTPEGNVFKNNNITSLKITADLWRGSVIDKTNVTYQWFKMDSSVSSDEGGGIGWKKLIDASSQIQGSITDTLTIYSTQVDNYAVFKCIATDTDPSSNSSGQKFMDTASIVDNSDPIQVIIQSTGGDVFKNGIGNTVLTAKVFQGGVEIDTEGNGTYTWSKYDSAGQKVVSFNKTGKTLSVGGADVDTKATFMVDVSI